MAEATIAITAGSGTLLHSNTRTIGSNTVHDEFTLPGEYPYASYVTFTTGISAAVANDHIIELMAGSTLNVKVRRIRVEQSANATAAAVTGLQVWRMSTAGTGGGVLTPAKFDVADAASGATAMTLPTAKGTELTQLFQFAMVWRQAVSATTAQVDDAWEWAQLPGQKPLVIAAGTTNGLCIKSTAAVAGLTLNCTIEFIEQNH